MIESLLQSMSRGVFLAIIFVIVVLLIMAIGILIESRSTMRRRIEETVAISNLSTAGGLRAEQTASAWTRLIDEIERRGLSLTDTNNEALRKKLQAAGYVSPYAPRWFTLIRLAMVIGLPTAAILTAISSASPPSLVKLYLMGVFLAIMGLYLPNLWVSAKASRREKDVTNGFPDSLDLMLVCVEAGLGLEAALDRVGSEMAISHPLISELLGKVVLELRAGRSREEALRRMGDSTGIDEIRSFSTLMIQTDKLGSSMAQTLRVYAAEMREKRRMRAEEKAYRLPVLLSIPLVTCMLPVMIGVLMLPAAIRIIRQLLPALSGG